MGVYVELINHDELYKRSSSVQFVINELNLKNSEDCKRINDLIFTSYSNDSLEIIPQCECGTLKGERNVGTVCVMCGFECQTVTERALQSVLWMKAPDGVSTLMNPHAYLMIKDKLKENGVSILDWLINPLYKVPVKEPIQIQKLKSQNIKRGINYFYENFDMIIDLLINGKIIRKGNQAKRLEFLEFLEKNKQNIFSQHVPIPSKLVFITEESPIWTYSDMINKFAIDAIRTINSIENSAVPLNVRIRQARAMKAISKISEYYHLFYRKHINPKEGWSRKHIFGSRIHFSFRGVITSIHDPHDYDEVYLPWGLSVTLLKYHIINKLYQHDPLMNPQKALQFINEHTLNYSSLLDKIFKELINESFAKGIPIILQRNPTLTRGSIILLNVTRIKTDIHDNTISLSALILKAANADFDGDALNGMLILDEQVYQRFLRFHPHLYVMDLEEPRKISGFIDLPAPVVSTIANFVNV